MQSFARSSAPLLAVLVGLIFDLVKAQGGSMSTEIPPLPTVGELLPASSCRAELKLPCAPGLHVDEITSYEKTVFITRPTYVTSNYTIILTATERRVNITTEVVEPVAICETTRTVKASEPLTVYVTHPTTITQELFSKSTTTEYVMSTYLSTLSMPCVQDAPIASSAAAMPQPPTVPEQSIADPTVGESPVAESSVAEPTVGEPPQQPLSPPDDTFSEDDL